MAWVYVALIDYYLIFLELSIKNAIVVGGGITGVAAALLLKEKAGSVDLYEASKYLGGTLRDWNEGGIAFSSTQYFNDNTQWFNLLRVPNKFYKFDHLYGSYTDIFGDEMISEDFAGPVFSGNTCAKIPLLSSKDISGKRLIDRINLYPPEISVPLENWFDSIGLDVNKVHKSSIVGFQASRIFIEGIEKEIKDLKKKSSILDDLYGLPRRSIGYPDISAYLPFNGYNDIFEHFLNTHTTKLRVNLSQTVNCKIENNTLKIKVKGQEISPRLVVWTADPTKLIRASGGVLDSNKFYAEILCGHLDEVVSSPFYIQVYSKHSKVLRIFLYNIKGRGCWTLEKALDNQPTEDVLAIAQSIISKFRRYLIISSWGRQRQVRYFAYTIKDFETLNDFQSNHGIRNLILSNYVAYGRDAKIDTILAQLERSDFL